jgi:hypothetical protein
MTVRALTTQQWAKLVGKCVLPELAGGAVAAGYLLSKS